MRPILVLTLALAGPAHATTGLAWQWDEDTTRSWLLQAQVKLPSPMWFRAVQNTEIRVGEVSFDLVTTCRPTSTAKRSWELRCDIDQVRLDAWPINATAEDLIPVLDEMDQALTDGWVQLTLRDDGRITSLDLEGVTKDNRREQAIHEVLRQLLLRAFAALDLELPRKGDDKGRGSWKQGPPLAMSMPTATGAVGAARIEHRIEGEVVEGGIAVVSSGHGTISGGETMSVGASEQATNLFEMSYEGSMRFDTERGVLVERAYEVQGAPTASSVSAEAGGGVMYVQRVNATLVPEGEEVPDLGPNMALLR